MTLLKGRLPVRGLLMIGFVIGLAMNACGGNEDEPSPTPTPSAESTKSPSPTTLITPTPSPTPSPSRQAGDDEWGLESVWSPDWDFFARCGEPWLLNPSDAEDAECILQVARDFGASAGAIDFYETTGNFLIDFSERGTVDYGQVAVVWINMSRPSLVMLNGAFGVLSIGELLSGVADDYRYVDLPGVWFEYAQMWSWQDSPAGQIFEVRFPLQVCRACDPVAYAPVTAAFNDEGVLIGTTLADPSYDQ